MTTKITLNLDETVYERARLLAEQQRQDVAKTLARWLDETLPPAAASVVPEGMEQMSDEDAALEREMQAYIALHPQLVRQHRHRYVAVHGGQLVDFDEDQAMLLQRIDTAYPDRIVWVSRVEDQPLDELFFRSPRLFSSGR